MQRKRRDTRQRNLEKKHGLSSYAWNQEKKLLYALFDESMSDYEKALVAEFGEEKITRERLNWRRWIEMVKCGGDPVRAMREYPARPSEAFSSPEEAILDPLVLAKWIGEAERAEPIPVRFVADGDGEGNLNVEAILGDPTGRTLVWEKPEKGAEYVCGADPSGGTPNGDWFVATVLRLDTGVQVAEFRSRMDPDQATDQIEALAHWYNGAFTGVEANSYGAPVCKELYERGTIPMYQREVPDHIQPNRMVQKVGWVTNSNTRNFLMNELRKAVREERCRICSRQTLEEGRTLTVARTPSGLERIEAKDGCHDDGIFAHGIAILMRNRMLPDAADPTRVEKIDEEDVPELVQELLRMNRQPRYRTRLGFPGRDVKHIKAHGIKIDGRRSLL